MRVHILSDLKDGPWGGGNQFLKGLREHLRAKRQYVEKPEDADVLLVNGHQWLASLFQIFWLKRRRRSLRIMHRVDGPMEIVRGTEDSYFLDRAIINFNQYFADATVFQSKWSQAQCYMNGMPKSKVSAVILNAADPVIFFKSEERPKLHRKIRIVTTSWSSNMRKGFDVIQFLDKQLDFSKYEFTFIGNSPVLFENIRHIRPISSAELAAELRNHDIFLQTSHLEACSNALIEAMTCGLIPVARNNSSHPEILGRSGVLYEGQEDVIAAIDAAVGKGDMYLDEAVGNLDMVFVGLAYLLLASQSAASCSTQPSLYAFLKTCALRVIAGRPRLFLSIKRAFHD